MSLDTQHHNQIPSLCTSLLSAAIGCVIFIIFAPFAHAALAQTTISLSKEGIMEGQDIRIYANINGVTEDTKGVAKFFDGTKQIGPDQPFSVLKGKTVDVFTDYERVPYGQRTITVKLYPWNKGNIVIASKKRFFADRDSDQDTIPDQKDGDDDNDGMPDEQDAFPLDPKETVDNDKDGIGDNADGDDDNDGVEDDKETALKTDPKNPDTDRDETIDGQDAFPLDPQEWDDHDRDGVGDNADGDDDGDGTTDERDALPFDPKDTSDIDHDGIGDTSDADMDGDGITNVREKETGTDPTKADTDGDGTGDDEDDLPLDPLEWNDNDRDGLGDNQDPNSTNKGPVIRATLPSSASVLWPYYFTAIDSSDPDGTIASLAWIVDGHSIRRPGFWYFFAMPGNHEVIIEATDDQNEQRVIKGRISVSGVPYMIVLIAVIAIVTFKVRKQR